MRGLELGDGLRLDIGIDGKGDVISDVDRGGLDLGRKSIALLESFHLQGVDALDDTIEFGIERRIVLDVEVAGDHEIHCAIEIRLGGFELARVVVLGAAGIGSLDGADQILLTRGCGGGSCGRCGGGLIGRSCRSSLDRSFCRSLGLGRLYGRSRRLRLLARCQNRGVIEGAAGERQNGQGKHGVGKESFANAHAKKTYVARSWRPGAGAFDQLYCPESVRNG